MDSYIKRQATADPQDKNAEMRAHREAMRSKPLIVRVSPPYNFGHCEELGLFVRETKSFLVYKNSEGHEKRVKKKSCPKMSRTLPRVAHTQVCKMCHEFKKPGSCIHNRVGFCETCMST